MILQKSLGFAMGSESDDLSEMFLNKYSLNYCWIGLKLLVILLINCII